MTRNPGASELPTGWIEAPLEAFTEIILGQSPPSSTYNSERRGLPFFQGKTEFGDSTPTARQWCTEPTKIANAGDILISVRAPVGPTNLCIEQAGIGRGLAAIRPLDGVELKYVLYALRAFESALAALGAGTTFEAISGSVLRGFPLPVAPSQEQARIVSELEALLSDLDAAVQTLQRARKRCDSYIGSLLNQTASADWPRTSLGDISVRITSGSRDWSQYYGHGSATFIMAQNVRAGGLDFSFRQPVDPPENDTSCERSQVKLNDILVTIVGANTGETCLVDRDLPQHYVCQSVALIRPTDPALGPFLSLFLAAPTGGQRQFDEFNYGAGRPHLSFEQLKATLVPVPPPEIRERVVAIVRADISAATQAKDTLEENLRRAARLRQSILEEAFRGKLVPQDPNDEPASVLLERIRAERDAPVKAKPTRLRKPRAQQVPAK